jgi:hypothetical protein
MEYNKKNGLSLEEQLVFDYFTANSCGTTLYVKHLAYDVRVLLRSQPKVLFRPGVVYDDVSHIVDDWFAYFQEKGLLKNMKKE